MKVLEVHFPRFFPVRVVLPDAYTEADCAVAGMVALSWSQDANPCRLPDNVEVLEVKGNAAPSDVFVYRYGEWRKE